MQKMLITGSGGFLGSRLVSYYRNTYEVVALGRAELDITKKSDVKEFLERCMPDIVIHCAAISDTGYAQNNPDKSYRVNVEGTINIALGCQAVGAKLIYMSSDQIYNGCTKLGALGETEVVMPQNVYGKHKLETERETLSIMPSSVGLRLTWMYDLPNRNQKTNSNLFCNLLKAIREDKALSFRTFEYRGITYVWEVVQQMNHMIALPGGIYNCGSENEQNTYETALYLAEQIVGKRAEHFVIKEQENKMLLEPNPVRNLAISNQKIKDYGISFLSTQEGFLKCMKEYGMIALSF